MAAIRPFRPLAVSLIRKTFAACSLCALIVCVIQASFSYQIVQQRQARAIRDIAASNLPLLALNVWDIEPQALAQQVEVIAEREEVGYAWVETKTGQRFFSGDGSTLGKAAAVSFNIPYPHTETGSIGTLHIVPNPGAVLREIGLYLVPTLIGYCVLTVLLCVFIAGLLARNLQRPLQSIADFVTRLTPQSLMQPLRLQRSWQSHRDEIDLVADGFRTLQAGVSAHIENLDQLVAERTQDLENALSTLQRVAMTDPLTGCFNRRHFDERFPMEVERAQRYGRPLAVMFCDADHFKCVNDSFGHAFGDEVLRGIAAYLKDDLRSEVDWAARYGGEEFVIVLPDTELAAACATAERLRRRIAEARFSTGAEDIAMTASFGVAEWRPGERALELLARADALMLQAKQRGRNRVLPAALDEDGQPLDFGSLVEGFEGDR